MFFKDEPLCGITNKAKFETLYRAYIGGKQNNECENRDKALDPSVLVKQMAVMIHTSTKI